VVHILHCDPQKPNQPTVQWVLDSFRRVAPEPAGLVLETGRYGGTLYAYLVTRMPDKAVLRGWVQQYNVQAKDTQEILIPAAPSMAETATATAEIAPPQPKPVEPKPAEPARVPVQFTQVFREFESQSSPSAPSTSAKEPEFPPLPLPILPLPNLGADEDPSGLRAAPAWDASTAATPVPPKQEPRLEPLFSSPLSPRADIPVQSFPPAPPKPPVADGPKPGEFTSFFRGPFHVEGPSENPSVSLPVSPQEMEPPRKSVGAFTEIFGPVTTPEQSQPSLKVAGGEPPSPPSSSRSSSGFTDLFANSELISRTPTPSAPPPSAGLPRAMSDTPATPSAPPKEAYSAPLPAAPVAPVAPVFTSLPPPMPVPPRPAAVMPAAPAIDGATGVFSTHSPSAPVSSEPVVPSGPSPYTQVISLRPPNVSGSPAGSQKAKAPAAPAFSLPSMPPLPAIAPPPMPPAPAIPKFAAPPPPAIKAPKVEPPPKPPVSYWPLVVVLTVLLFIAVLLVLYFVLKH